jgi:hypothetical protein
MYIMEVTSLKEAQPLDRSIRQCYISQQATVFLCNNLAETLYRMWDKWHIITTGKGRKPQNKTKM